MVRATFADFLTDDVKIDLLSLGIDVELLSTLTKDIPLFTRRADATVDALVNTTWILDEPYKKPGYFADAEKAGDGAWKHFLVQKSDEYQRINPRAEEDKVAEYYNIGWKHPDHTRTHAEICTTLDKGISVALGKFERDKGKVRRRKELQLWTHGVLLDQDRDIPTHITTCSDMIQEVPFLRYATGIRESLSSRTPRKNGISQFRLYFGFETAIAVDKQQNAREVRTFETLSTLLAIFARHADRNIVKNTVCIAYGNARPNLSKSNSESVVSKQFIDKIREYVRIIAENETQQQRQSYAYGRQQGSTANHEYTGEGTFTDTELLQFLTSHKIENEKRHGGGFYVECPYKQNHTGGVSNRTDAYVFCGDHGFAFYCSHASCKEAGNNTWRRFKQGIGIDRRPQAHHAPLTIPLKISNASLTKPHRQKSGHAAHLSVFQY